MEIQDQVRRGVGLPFAGETHWNWTVDPRGRFYVTVDYDNEIVALAAIRLAERVINALDSKDIAQIDMAREIARLRELAKHQPPLHRRPPRPAPPGAPPAAGRRKRRRLRPRLDGDGRAPRPARIPSVILAVEDREDADQRPDHRQRVWREAGAALRDVDVVAGLDQRTSPCICRVAEVQLDVWPCPAGGRADDRHFLLARPGRPAPGPPMRLGEGRRRRRESVLAGLRTAPVMV